MCFYLTSRNLQLSWRTGSALLQMSGKPFRGNSQGCKAQCRGYKVRMKGDFVPHELLQTLITQRSGVTHSLCTSAVLKKICCCCRKRRVSTNDEGLWKAAWTCEERCREQGRKRRLIRHLRCLARMLASKKTSPFIEHISKKGYHRQPQFVPQHATLSSNLYDLGWSMHLHRGCFLLV